jgi:hypothetical protein
MTMMNRQKGTKVTAAKVLWAGITTKKKVSGLATSLEKL